MPVHAQMGYDDIFPTDSQPGTIRRRMVNTTLRPLHSQLRLGVYCRGGWIGFGTGLGGTKTSPHRDWMNGSSSPLTVAIPTKPSRPLFNGWI